MEVWDKGASSGFSPAHLPAPEGFDLLSEWTDEELKGFPVPARGQAAEAQRKENDEAMELLRKHSPGTLQSVTPEKMAWALNMVRSRVFSGRLSDNAVTKANLSTPRARRGNRVRRVPHVSDHRGEVARGVRHARPRRL